MSANSISFSAAGIQRRILSATATVAGVGVLVKLIATAKEIVIADVYGRSDAIEAWIAASLLPGLLINLIAESMNQALAPTWIRVRENEGRAQAQRLLSNALLSVCILLILVCIAMAVSAPWIFRITASRFNLVKMNLAVHLFYALLPTVVLTAIASNCAAALNAVEHYALPALAPIVTSLALIACALLLDKRLGVWALAIATLASSSMQAAGLMGLLRRYGYHFRLRWHGLNNATREVAHQFGHILFSSIIASGGLVVDQTMAAELPAGSVSTLAYASRLVSVIVALLASSISAALTPHLSVMVTRRDWEACRQTVRRWMLLMALISVPLTIVLIADSRQLVRLALEHGVFGPRDTAAVTPVLILYALQIPFYVCSRVPYRLVLAMRRTDLILACGVVNLILDIILNFMLMHWLGVAGIALATSLWCIATWIFFAYWSRRLLRAASQSRP